MNAKLPGMSLIEMIVVIMITAVLLGLGMASLVAMRNNLTVRQSGTEMVHAINLVRNDARNSVLFGKDPNDDRATIAAVDKLDYYIVGFANNTFSRGTCDEDILLNCEFDTNPLKSNTYDVVEATPVGPSDGDGGLTGGNPADCSAIVVYLTTGKFQFGRLNGLETTATVTLNNTENCIYKLEHSQTRGTNVLIEISGGNGKIKII